MKRDKSDPTTNDERNDALVASTNIAPSPSEDLLRFEVDVDTDEDLGSGPEIDALRIGAPPEHVFVRTSPRIARLRLFVRMVDGNPYPVREHYLVTEDVAKEVSADVGLFDLHTWATTDRLGGAILLSTTATDTYNATMKKFVQRGQKEWVRFTRDRQSVKGERIVVAAKEDLGAPAFGTVDKAVLIAVVFQDRHITSVAHPVIRALLGRR